MNVFIRFYRIVKNLGSLLRALSRYEHFSWDLNSCRITNCMIDDTSVVYGNYVLKNVEIGYSSYISNNATILNTTIGKFCSIGPNIVCGWGVHPINGVSTHPAFYSSTRRSLFTLCEVNQAEEHQPIVIGNDVFIGANVTILDGIIIGDGAVIGAGAVVSKNIPPYAVAVGCPIKIIKYRFSPETIQGLIKSQWWDHKDLFEKIKHNFFQVDNFLASLTHEDSESLEHVNI